MGTDDFLQSSETHQQWMLRQILSAVQKPDPDTLKLKWSQFEAVRGAFEYVEVYPNIYIILL